MAPSLRYLRQVATLRHGHMARRSASLRSCIQDTRGMWTRVPIPQYQYFGLQYQYQYQNQYLENCSIPILITFFSIPIPISPIPNRRVYVFRIRNWIGNSILSFLSVPIAIMTEQSPNASDANTGDVIQLQATVEYRVNKASKSEINKFWIQERYAGIEIPDVNISDYVIKSSIWVFSILFERLVCRPEGKWSLGLMPFGLKLFGLIQLVAWPNFLS